MHVRVYPSAVDSEVVVGGQDSEMDCTAMVARLVAHSLLAWPVCMNPDELLATEVMRASEAKSVRLAENRPLPGSLSSCGVATVKLEIARSPRAGALCLRKLAKIQWKSNLAPSLQLLR